MAKIYGSTTTTPIKPDLFDGSGGVVDQTYNPSSENAQSGKAVAEAIKNISSGSAKAEVKDDVLYLTQSGDSLKVNITEENVLVIN